MTEAATIPKLYFWVALSKGGPKKWIGFGSALHQYKSCNQNGSIVRVSILGK